MLTDMGQSDEKLLARYDIAIHVTSCAQGLSYMYDVRGERSRPVAGRDAQLRARLKEGLLGGCRHCEKFRNACLCRMARHTSAVFFSDI